MTASWTCFYCGNRINRNGPHRLALIRHGYKNGGTRVSERRFHVPCFDRFEAYGGRPFNPHTTYQTLGSSLVEGEEPR
jgi:hypothetical protein